MIDISRTIAPKSDQLNADDLIGQPRTIKITGVTPIDNLDQPIAIRFEGDGGKPYKPCKSMRRVLVRVWGIDGTAYIGRRMTLYRDDKVQFGGMDVGGIRISHMSGIKQNMTFPLTASKTKRIQWTIRPLGEEQPASQGKEPVGQGTDVPPKPNQGSTATEERALFVRAREKARAGSEALRDWWDRLNQRQRDELAAIQPELDRLADDADARDDFPGFSDASEHGAAA